MDFDGYVSEPLPFIGELAKYFKRSDNLTLFDIGCCEGEDSIRLKKYYPNSTVYSFEPLPNNVAKIKKHFKRYGLAADKLFELALSDKNGTAAFHVSSGHPSHLPKVKGWDFGNKSSSLLPPKEHTKVLEWVKFDQKVRVKTSRLDTFCKEHSISKIDLAYIDVQGAELMVLEGAGSLIKNIGAVWMEVGAVELYAKQPLKKDVEKFMKRNGFMRIKDTVDAVSGDQLYVNASLKARPLHKLSGLLGRKKADLG